MKKLAILSVPIIALLVIIIGCNSSKDNNKVKIRVKTSDDSLKVKINSYANLNITTLAEAKTDSTGTCYLEFNLSKPTIAYIEVGKIWPEVYLEPGYDLTITIDHSTTEQKVYYEGKGAEINNYIAMANAMIDKNLSRGGKFISELDTADFSLRLDSLKTELISFNKRYVDSVALPEKICFLLNEKYKMQLLEVRKTYEEMALSSVFLDQMQGLQTDENIIAYKSMTVERNANAKIPFDTALLNLGISAYNNLLAIYVRNKYIVPIYDIKTWDKMQYHFPTSSYSMIMKDEHPPAIKEFLIAQDIQKWLQMHGITQATDSILSNFKNDFKTSRYLPALQKEYDEWMSISKGHLAPDFSGTMLDGKDFSLSDLRGKVVYIDVWATWCAPCREEIPHAKKLQKEFSKGDAVEFLYVSVDRDSAKWKKMVLADKEWKGIHIIMQRDRDDLFMNAYKMNGVPSYVLIDQEGKIVEAIASRPSEGKIKNQIDSLLNMNLNE